MLIDLTGQKFGRLTVIGRAEKPGHMVYWNCICDCGNSHIATGAYLKNGKIKSCGCLHKEESAVRAKYQFTKHADSGSRLYRIWKSIKEWSSLTGINYGTLKTRISSGWNEDKLLHPVNHG